MTNHQNPSNAQRDFKNNKLQTLTEKVEIGLTLNKRLYLNAPPTAPSAILFQTLKRHFPKFKARIHVEVRLIMKTTNQQIAHQQSNKRTKASRYTSRKQTPKILSVRKKSHGPVCVLLSFTLYNESLSNFLSPPPQKYEY